MLLAAVVVTFAGLPMYLAQPEKVLPLVTTTTVKRRSSGYQSAGSCPFQFQPE